MENKDEDINERKVRNKDVLSKKELINMLDMTAYKERIDNIIGRNYSFLFFDFFDIIYHSKWMCLYKSMKFYSHNENLPILIH